MNPKSVSISNTAVVSDKNWVAADVRLRTTRGSTAVSNDPDALVISVRVMRGDQKIVTTVEPTAATRRAAIRKLNNEIEGRLSPYDTHASKTAG
jgi:hypothetical protein